MQLRFSQIHVTILNFVLIAVLAIVSAMCVRDIIVRSVSSDADTPAVHSFLPKNSNGLRTRSYYDLIVRRDIFNETPQDTGPAPVVEADLNIKLVGTSLASRTKPFAIIEDPSGEESLYQVGEDIPDAGRLVSVETNRAIIDRNGHRVALELPTTDMDAVPPSDLGGSPANRPIPGFMRNRGLRGLPDALRRRIARLHHPSASSDDNDNDSNDSNDNDNSDDDDSDDNSSSKIDIKKLGPGQFEVSRAEVQQNMENPSQFFTQMRALPHMVDGKTDGFSISQVAPG